MGKTGWEIIVSSSCASSKNFSFRRDVNYVSLRSLGLSDSFKNFLWTSIFVINTFSLQLTWKNCRDLLCTQKLATSDNDATGIVCHEQCQQLAAQGEVEVHWQQQLICLLWMLNLLRVTVGISSLLKFLPRIFQMIINNQIIVWFDYDIVETNGFSAQSLDFKEYLFV